MQAMLSSVAGAALSAQASGPAWRPDVLAVSLVVHSLGLAQYRIPDAYVFGG